MEGLILQSGGRLLFGSSTGVDETRNADTDVTESAASYLTEGVRFEGEVYMRDIFALLNANPVLLEVFARMRASEYLDESREVVSAKPYSDEYDPAEIEYLELFPNWEMDNLTGRATQNHRLCFRGVGFELREDLEFSGCKYEKGTRIRYAIAYTPLPELLNLPVRFEAEVRAPDVKCTGERHRDKHLTVIMRPTLAQVLDGVLYEMSFGGTSEGQAEFAKKLKQIADDDSQWTTYDSAEDLLRSMGLCPKA